MPVLIPDSYVADLNLRLGLYRRLSTLVDRGEIDAFAAELVDRFGPLPPEVDNLLQIMAIKRLCREAGVERLDAGPKGATVAFHNNAFANPVGLIAFIQRSEEHTSELQSLMRISYAVFCLKKKKTKSNSNEQGNTN